MKKTTRKTCLVEKEDGLITVVGACAVAFVLCLGQWTAPVLKKAANAPSDPCLREKTIPGLDAAKCLSERGLKP